MNLTISEAPSSSKSPRVYTKIQSELGFVLFKLPGLKHIFLTRITLQTYLYQQLLPMGKLTHTLLASSFLDPRNSSVPLVLGKLGWLVSLLME